MIVVVCLGEDISQDLLRAVGSGLDGSSRFDKPLLNERLLDRTAPRQLPPTLSAFALKVILLQDSIAPRAATTRFQLFSLDLLDRLHSSCADL